VTVPPRFLALWLSPAVWVTLPALLVALGPDALWAGLLLLVGPLLALALDSRAAAGEADGLRARLPGTAGLAMGGLLLCANFAVAGDAAAVLGVPRWQGIATAAGAAWLCALPHRARRAPGALLLLALAAVGLALGVVARVSAEGPLAAWARVASQPAFRLGASSASVVAGLPSSLERARPALFLEEEHRVSAAAPATLRARIRDAGETVTREWALSVGQAVTLRPGDVLVGASGGALRFEADRRVPGAPPSGAAWARGGQSDWAWYLGIAVTVLGGAAALVGAAGPPRLPRAGVVAVAAAALVVLAWAQGWALYGALGAPEVFLVATAAERVLGLPRLVVNPAGLADGVRILVVAALAAGLLAAAGALRQFPSPSLRAGGRRARPGLARWTGVVGAAALASLPPIEPWALVLLGFGLGASAVAPPFLLRPPDRHPEAASAASAIGLGVFVALAVAGHVRAAPDGLLGLIFAYPAVAAAPAALTVLWLSRR
jgi:hypothetical protein